MAALDNINIAALRAPPTRWSLGRLIPILLLLWAMTDIGFRFMPEEWFRVQLVQVATRVPGRYSPFVPNLKLRVDNGVGEQALLANLAPTEKVPPQTFSTDRLGFRVTPGVLEEEPPQVFVFKGDSFTVGVALSDEDTFASALQRKLGVGVYNAGKFFTDVDGLRELNWLMDQRKAKRPTVICVYLESSKRRFLASLDSDVKKTDRPSGLLGRAGSKRLGAPGYAEYKDSALFRFRRYSAWWNISPLKIVSIRGYKALYKGSFLPNESAHKIEVRHLPNNNPVLLDPDKLQNYSTPPDERITTRTADYMAWMRDQLAAQGINFWVLLLPDKESVYEAEILNTKEAELQGDKVYLNRLEGELDRRSVKSVNALTVLRRTADEDWATGQQGVFPTTARIITGLHAGSHASRARLKTHCA